MKNIILGSMLIISLQGCLVTEKTYQTQAEINKTADVISKDSLFLSCGIPRGEDKSLGITVWFDARKQQEGISDISVTVQADDGRIIAFNYVKMVSMKLWAFTYSDPKYRKRDFYELPENNRLTSLDGQEVFYDFDFNAKRNIRSKNLYIVAIVKLKSGKIMEIKGNYLRVTRHFFSIH